MSAFNLSLCLVLSLCTLSPDRLAAQTPSTTQQQGFKPEHEVEESWSLWEWFKDYLFEKGTPSFNGFFTLGYKPVYWWNERLDSSLANSSLDSRLGAFSLVEFGLQTSKGWMLRIALPDEEELRENIEYLKLFIQTDRLFVGLETGGVRAKLRYGADEYKFGSLGGEDPIYSSPIEMNFSTGYRRVSLGLITQYLRYEGYYYSYNKPYFYNMIGIPRAFESLDPRSTYEGYFLGGVIDTYNRTLRARPGWVNSSYFIIRLGLGYGITRLSQEYLDEINLLTNRNFSREMNSQIVLNETAEIGRMIGMLKRDGFGYALSFGAFVDLDLPFGSAKQKRGPLTLVTSNTVVDSNVDFFYGLVLRASLTW